MKRKGLFKDLGFWILVGTNIFLLYYYSQHKEVFTTLIWLYWAQSVMLGFFNFLDMLTVRKEIPNTMTINGIPNTSESSLSGPGAFFFLFHYGFFHFGYLIFIAIMKRTGPFDWYLFKYCLIAFFLGQVMTFIRHKIEQKTKAVNLGTMFITPYMRIIPMHLTILLPGILGISQVGIFLVLKALADVVMYIVTKPAGNNQNVDTAFIASQQTLNG